MALKVTYTHPAFPEGYEFEIYGVGLVENGTAKTLTKEEEESAVTKLGMAADEYMKGSSDLKVEGKSDLKADEVQALIPPEEPQLEAPPEETQVIEPTKEGGES